MNSYIAYPFLTCKENNISSSPWLLNLNASPIGEVEYFVPGWDYSSNIEFKRTIEVNLPQISITLGIPLKSLDLEIVTILGTGQGRIPRSRSVIHRYSIEEKKQKYELIISCESLQLSRRVKIETFVVIASTPSNHALLSPTTVGSKVWSDEIDLRLEGNEPRFPMETASFQKMFANKIITNSLWYLSWRTEEWDEDFIGSVRLYLNADNNDFVKRFLDLDPYTHQTVMSDIIIQILSKFLSDPTTEESFDTFEVDSVGSHASNWITAAFPHKSYSSAKSLLENRPGDFHATILALSNFKRPNKDD